MAAQQDEDQIQLLSSVGGDADVEEFKDAFKLFDKNDDGQISVDELHEVFTSLNFQFTTQQIERMISSVDQDDNKCIDVDEFIALMKRKVTSKKGGRHRKKAYAQELEEAFDVFDIDGNGHITCNELANIMKNLGETLSEQDIEFMIEEIDMDNDGTIDLGEFQKMMMQGPSRSS